MTKRSDEVYCSWKIDVNHRPFYYMDMPAGDLRVQALFIEGTNLPGSSKRSLAPAVKIWAEVDTEDVAVSVVEPHAIQHAANGSAAALHPPVDDVGDHAVTGLPSGGEVCVRRAPCSGDDVMG